MYVYLIATDSRSGQVKIGKANNPAKRLESLSSGNPEPLHIKHLIQCKSVKQAQALEKMLHHVLAKHRTHGEWFTVQAVGRFRKVCGKYAQLMLPKHPDARLACWRVN